MFARYAALVKNLRGVVLINPREQQGEELIDWLNRKFRYRNLGLSPRLISEEPKFFKPYLKGKPFLELAYPVESLDALTNILSSNTPTKAEVLETVILASAYISPIICLGIRSYEEIIPLVVDEVRATTELGDKELKQHLRIADYSVLDLYSWSIEHTRGLWEGFDLQRFTEDRKERISRDRKRFWRIAGGNLWPKPFIAYLDLAQFAASSGEVKRLAKEEAVAGLAIVPAVILGVH